MKTKTDAEVIIGGKRYNISGYESAEYLQKIASYLNGKYAELKSLDGYRLLDVDTKVVLMQINLADDYFRTKDQLKEVSDDRESQDTELFNLKHDIIELQKKLESSQDAAKKQIVSDRETYTKNMESSARQLEENREKLVETEKKLIKAETENESLRKSLEDALEALKKLQSEHEMLKKRNGKR